jgi:DNA helicase IV
MAKRKFRLPGIQELTKDQDRVNRLPKEGQFLIVGGPGTGKSVVALQRVLKYHEEKNYIFLVFNKILRAASQQLAGGKISSSTWMSWFYKAVLHNLKSSDPEIKDVPEIKKFIPDYNVIVKILNDLKLESDPIQIIIDEGQDMPPKFYETLQYMGIENFFVVADQNQQITDQNSKKEELITALGLDTKDVIELKENFRNTYDVARLARHFYTDPSSPPPYLPVATRQSIGVPLLLEYRDLNKAITRILREADRSPNTLIGVIVPTNDVLDVYINALREIEISLDNPKPIISSYKSGNNIDIDFTEGGIVVINDKSVKGVEFDSVFIADIDKFIIYGRDIESMKKRFYVMVSRAINNVIILRNSNNSCEVCSLLPTDEKILKRIRS